MAAPGLLLRINGESTDTTVANDSASYTAKVGRINITGGGGSWWKESQPSVCRIDAKIPLRYAHLVRTVTVGVDGPSADRVVFHGNVVQARATVDGMCQFDCTSEMSALLSRRARTTATVNTGIRALLTDIETAHGITLANGNSFPSAADFPNLDRPQQKRTSNGEFIRTALAGTGINMAEQWGGTMAAPTLEWRPDYFDSVYSASVDVTSQQSWNVGYPWLLSYENAGLVWNDFVARVVVNGENAAAVEKYGWAQLTSNTMRTQLGHRNVTLNSMIDNQTDLERAARRLIAFQGEPKYLRMHAFTGSAAALWRAVDAGGGIDTADVEAYTFATLHPGDLCVTRTPWGNTNTDYANWPAHFPSGSEGYYGLSELWSPYINDDAVTGFAVEHVVRTVTRVWQPTEGWWVTLGVDPHGANGGLKGTDIADYSGGDY